MTSFNLSEWALRNKSFVVYLMLVSAIAGLWAYGRLGREEDPPFTIKTMVVKTLWPGATATDTLSQVTDRIEKKLEELPYLDFVRSYTKPGESVVFVNLKDTVAAKAVPDLWYQVHKKIDDISHTLPSGINGPFFNDEFGDTYSLVFALVADGFSHRAEFAVAAGETATFVLGYGPSFHPLPEPVRPLAALAETEKAWQTWTAPYRPAGKWGDEVLRSLLTLKALTYRPTGGIVAAPTTSLPEAIGGVRNWDYRYTWVRDAAFTVYSLMRLGYTEEAGAFARFMQDRTTQ